MTEQTDSPDHGKLWSLLDWSFWGAGMGDVFREPLADAMVAAVPAETVAQAEEIMAEFIERRKIEKTGVTIWQEQRDELERLRKERDAFRDQRNAVFKTNERLHAEVQESDRARLHAENETRKLTRANLEAADRAQKEINQLRADLDTVRNHVAELEAYALGCDAEGCTIPHSSWCETAKKTAAANNGCTCPQPWKDSPQPHAAYCWLLSPPRDEVEEMRKKVAEVIAGRNAAAIELGQAARKAIAKAETERDEAFRCRDAALRAFQRDDVETDVHLPDLIADGLHGLAEWDTEPPDQAPDWLVNAIVALVRPVLAKTTEQRDQARRDCAHWQHELQLADQRITELRAATEMGEGR